MGVLQKRGLRFKQEDILLGGQPGDRFIVLLGIDHRNDLADIVQQGAYEEFFNLVVTNLFADDFRRHRTPQGVIPEFFACDLQLTFTIGKDVEHRRGQQQMPDGIEAQQHNSAGDGCDALGKTVERRIDQPQQACRKHLVVRDHLGQIPRRGARVVDHLRDAKHRPGQGGEIVNATNHRF